MTSRRLWLWAGLLVLISACTTQRVPSPMVPPTGAEVPRGVEPTPRDEPKSRYGNPEYYEVDGRVYRVVDSSAGYVERGVASWYGDKFHGRRTSSGEPYDMHAMTAAHKTLPLPTYARVTNLDTGDSVVVRINDRGPFVKNRLIDMSFAAAKKLNMTEKGTANVEVVALSTNLPGHAARTSSRDAGQALYVQVGAYADRTRAESVASRVRSDYQVAVALSPARVRGMQLYRVRIGPLAGAADAEQLVAALSDSVFGTPKVVWD